MRRFSDPREETKQLIAATRLKVRESKEALAASNKVLDRLASLRPVVVAMALAQPRSNSDQED